MKVAEVIFSIILFLIALAMFLVGLTYPYTSGSGLGPGFAPVWVSAIMMFFTLILSISLIRNLKGGRFFASKIGVRDLFIYIFLMILTVIFTRIVGLVIALGLFCFIIFRYVEKYNLKSSVMVSVGAALIIFIIFDLWLSIPLPGPSIL